MSTPVVLTWGNLANGYCFPNDLNQFKDDLFNLLSGTVDVNGVVISQTTPAVGDRGKLWIKLDSSNRPLGQFIFLGSWIWPHPTPLSGKERRMYAGADGAGDLWAYDGGDGTDPALATATTGSFWAIDHDFDFKIPMGPGTNGTSYDGNAATVLAQGGTMGQERDTLLTEQLPAIQLGILNTDGANGYIGSQNSTGTNESDGTIGEGGIQTKNRALTDYLNTPGSKGTITATKTHSTMPPVRGIYIIKRSARQFYVGA